MVGTINVLPRKGWPWKRRKDTPWPTHQPPAPAAPGWPCSPQPRCRWQQGQRPPRRSRSGKTRTAVAARTGWTTCRPMALPWRCTTPATTPFAPAWACRKSWARATPRWSAATWSRAMCPPAMCVPCCSKSPMRWAW